VVKWLACLSLDPRFAGSIPAEVDRFLGVIKIRRTPSFGGEVKPLAPCRNILRHVKEPFEVWKICSRQNSSFPSPVPLTLLLDYSAGRTARELWWMNQEFPLSISFHHGSSWISPGVWTIGLLVTSVQRRSLIPSTWSPSIFLRI
jgi:hypothetical protein